MRAFRKHLKLIVLVLCVPFFIQSCTVYKSANVSLYDAAKSNSKIKVIKKNGVIEKFDKVELFDDGQFYGKILYEDENIFIDKNSVQKVQLIDKKTSTIITIAIPVFVLGLIAGVVAIGLQ